MPASSYELARLDANTFEHLINSLALRVLGPGHTGFGPGPDGGRDGYFEGTAPYPSTNDCWSGTWYVQSKFLSPHLSKDPQKWLLDRIKEEIEAFQKPDSRRRWPDNWIIATNIDPSGSPETGSFDRALALVKAARPALATHFHIWGGKKILDLLASHPEIGEYYGEFLTPGQLLVNLYAQASDAQAQVAQIVRHLVVTQFTEQQYTRLEQAGSTTDNRPGIQRLFSDIPFVSLAHKMKAMAASTLALALAQTHKIKSGVGDNWIEWQRNPSRARTWFVKGGPGQGKSTLTQFISQIQRAALILQDNGPPVLAQQKLVASDIRSVAINKELWPTVPRIPVIVDLKEFAFWYGQRGKRLTDRMIAFFSETFTNAIGEHVQTGTLRRAFGSSRWMFVFDGLDEVPSDVKDSVASEVTHFVNDVLVGYGADAAIICTSRPQGYSGQFSNLDAAIVELTSLSPEEALACAEPLLGLDRSESEHRFYIKILKEALQSEAVAEIMTTPLQAHIMAVIVRDGGKPPERKWQLYNTFYEIIKKREANRNLPDRRLASLLREGDRLLKALHNRLGFELHARAETSRGAVTSLNRQELLKIVEEVVSDLQDKDVPETVSTLMRATTERLVLVSTPEASDNVRFDIRPLQEFFAGEYVYQSAEPDTFVDRVRTIAGDSHWREVIHFLLSALVENNRKSELAAAITVFVQLDDGGDRAVRGLNRRLARGGIVAARLLQEGVLEQDKRLRDQFRNCIIPLAGCTDAGAYLSQIRAHHSVQWLIDVLLAVLREQAEPETIGAIIALSVLIPGSDSRCEILKQTLLHGSKSYQRFFLEKLPYRDDMAPPWIPQFAFEILLRDDWWTFGRQAVSLAIRVIANAKNPSEAACHCGVDPLLDRLIAKFFQPSDNLRYGKTPDHEEERFGVLTYRYLKPAAEIDWQNWSTEIWVKLKSSRGILNAIYQTLNFVRLPNAANLAALTEALGGQLQNAELMPESIRSFLELRDFPFERPAKTRLASLVARTKPGYLLDLSLSSKSLVGVDWVGVITAQTWLAVYLVLRNPPETRDIFADTEVQRLLIENLSKDVAISYAPRWGILFELPQPLGENLRQLVLSYCADSLPSRDVFEARIDEFKVRLPNEAAMLPHILASLVTVFSRENPVRPEKIERPREMIVRSIGNYFDSVDSLLRIADDLTFSKSIRAAATILAGLHPATEPLSRREPDGATLINLYEPAGSVWFLPAVAWLLNEPIVAGRIDGFAAMGTLLDHVNADFKGRSAITMAISDWREISRAPVSQSGLELWK